MDSHTTERRVRPGKSAAVSNPTLTLPPIVFGTSALGNLFQALDMATKRAIVAEWFKSSDGIVAADSAGKYGAGLALEVMSQTLQELGIKPSQLLISNKLGWRRVPLTTPEPTFEPGAWIDIEHDAIQDISYDGILRCYEQGCEMLHPYKAQLVSVHDPDEYLAAASDGHDRQARMDDIMGAYQALRELRDAGHVTAIGVGSKDWRVSEEICKHCDLDWVMLATSLTIFTHDRDVLTFVQRCRDQSIRVINSAVFHSGFLTGGDFFDYKEIDPKHERDRQLMGWRDRFNAICESYGVSPAQACVSFGLSPPGVDSIALNSSQASRVQENVSLVSSHPPREFWQALKNAELIASEYPYLP